MLRNIYHGSSHIIKSPRFGAVRAYNDYGLGFYCTEDPDLAREWSVTAVSGGFVNSYSIECAGLRIVDLCSSEYNVLHWLTVLLQSRDFDTPSRQAYYGREFLKSAFTIDYQNCDCMIGYRADDSNFSFAQDFLDGRLSYRELRSAVAKSGRQFVLKSNRAFDRITFTGYEPTRSEEWYPAKVTRDLAARRRVYGQKADPAALPASPSQQTAQSSQTADDLFISQILNEEIRPYDKRLR